MTSPTGACTPVMSGRRDAFRKAAPFLPFGVEPVSIPFDGTWRMPGYGVPGGAGPRRSPARPLVTEGEGDFASERTSSTR